MLVLLVLLQLLVQQLLQLLLVHESTLAHTAGRVYASLRDPSTFRRP